MGWKTKYDLEMSRLYRVLERNPANLTLHDQNKQVEVGGGMPGVQVRNERAAGRPHSSIPGRQNQMDYDSLRRQARTLEFLLDSKLTAYSRVVTTVATDGNDIESGGSTERWQDLQVEIEDLLEKLNEINEGMSALLNDADSPPSQALQHSVQRHRDVLRDYNRDFTRTKTNVQTAMERANLLASVRNDIDAYHRSSAADSLLAERGRIDSSHQMTDDLLGQAYATRDEFSRQRSSLASINARMSGVLNTLPGVDSLLSMIKSRRRRDTVILGCIIGLCIVFLLSYLSR